FIVRASSSRRANRSTFSRKPAPAMLAGRSKPPSAPVTVWPDRRRAWNAAVAVCSGFVQYRDGRPTAGGGVTAWSQPGDAQVAVVTETSVIARSLVCLFAIASERKKETNETNPPVTVLPGVPTGSTT